MSKRIRLLIVISVLLNVLLVGVLLGMGATHVGRMRHHPPMADAIRDLPKDRRVELKRAMDEMREQGEKIQDEIRKQRKAVTGTLGAENFDVEAYRKNVEVMHELHGKRVRMMADTVAKLAQEWSREDRKALAEVLRRPPHPPRGGPPPRSDGKPPPEF